MTCPSDRWTKLVGDALAVLSGRCNTGGAAGRNNRLSAVLVLERERSCCHAVLTLALQTVGPGHGIFCKLNELLILCSGKGALKSHAQGCESERILRIQFTGALPVSDGLFVLAQFSMHDC